MVPILGRQLRPIPRSNYKFSEPLPLSRKNGFLTLLLSEVNVQGKRETRISGGKDWVIKRRKVEGEGRREMSR